MPSTVQGRQQKRAKEYGYETERAALRALAPVFPGLRRVGSPGYSKAHPDLVRDGIGYTVIAVVTRDKNKGLLITLSTGDLHLLMHHNELPVAIQVKGRKETWIGRLYEELKNSVTRGSSPNP